MWGDGGTGMRCVLIICHDMHGHGCIYLRYWKSRSRTFALKFSRLMDSTGYMTYSVRNWA
jgi:hypothetical protein